MYRWAVGVALMTTKGARSGVTPNNSFVLPRARTWRQSSFGPPRDLGPPAMWGLRGLGGSRCLATVQHDASQEGKVLFTTVLTSTMGDLVYAENADRHYMYGPANGNGKAELRIHHAQFSDRRMPDHGILQRLQHQRETRSFHVTRYDAS
ncbi:hypothetical protein TNCV_2304041 [Trichonephila clavipes]|nr:hypothetical protein TNCV_2304041 [Trichonephila clavipes]